MLCTDSQFSVSSICQGHLLNVKISVGSSLKAENLGWQFFAKSAHILLCVYDVARKKHHVVWCRSCMTDAKN